LTPPSDLLAQISDTSRLPVEALCKANTYRKSLVPIFLDQISRCLAAADYEPGRSTPLFFIFHLLGSWREKAAYPLLAEFLRAPPDFLQDVLGDAITVTSHRVMIAVFDGDPLPLQRLILDAEAEPLVRSRMLEALAILALQEKIPRNDLADFLRSCFTKLQPQHDCLVWLGWQSAIAMLGLAETQLLVKQAFDRGSIDPRMLTYDHFIRDLRMTIDGGSCPRSQEYAPFGDIIEELSTWHHFQP
jgi:hypothetical protein